MPHQGSLRRLAQDVRPQVRRSARIFGEWKQSRSADALGPASGAAAYLFSELARLGSLESELFVDDARYENRTKRSFNGTGG